MGKQSTLHDSYGPLDERVERGKSLRKQVSRTSQGGYAPAADRRDPIAVLEEQATTRVPELLPIRYGRMASSPFAFYRGAAAIMAMDLATTPVSGIKAQLCGDAHLVNFGIYNSPDRRLVFDLNDFDETLPGPWEWDVKRLAASLVVAGQDNGFSESETATVVRKGVEQYRLAMAGFAGQRNLDVWYSRMEVEAVVSDLRARMDKQRAKAVKRNIAKFAARDNLQAFGKLTTVVDGVPRFASEPPLVVPLRELAESEEFAGHDANAWVANAARRVLSDYRRSLDDDRRHLIGQYEFTDLARKVVGVGSVGTRAWIVLLLGRDETDPLILQFKEAGRSVLEPHIGESQYDQGGHRVVAGQRLMQATSDIFLGWYRGEGLDGVARSFYVRQLRDGKGSIDVAAMDAPSLAAYAGLCAWTLARAHARSADRVAIASYLGGSGSFDEAMVTFGHLYAEQNKLDHAALVAAIADGRITALQGV
ncbi:MAG: DUF2252 domain-containing protein [Candidatus Nanopelagicales bacterium]